MARRALFCPTCTELLEQLEKAADAVCHGESAFREVRQQALDDGTQLDLRIQYPRIKERAQEHLERHVHSRSADPISCVRLRA